MKREMEFPVERMRCVIATGNENTRQKVKFEFEVDTSIIDASRPLYWQQNGAPLYLKIGSNQLEMDLAIKSYKEGDQVPMDANIIAGSKEHQAAIEDLIATGHAETVAQFEKEEADAHAKEVSDLAERAKAEHPDFIKPEEKVASTPVRSGEPITPKTEKPAKEKKTRKARADKGTKVPAKPPDMVPGKTCQNCGYIATPDEIAENGENACPACGKSMEVTTEDPATKVEGNGQKSADELFDAIPSGRQEKEAGV